MSDNVAIRALLDRLYAARMVDDIKGMMSCFAPDATAQIAGSAEFCPAATSVSGFDDVQALLQRLIDGWTFVDRRELSTVIAQDKAAVHSRVTLRYRETNQTIETELHDLWSMRDDKIISFVEFVDTAMVNHAMMQPALDRYLSSPRANASNNNSFDRHRASIQDIVDKAYALRASGDVNALMACFSPDATFRLAGASEASPGAMKAHGEAEIRPRMDQLCKTWEFIGREQLWLVVDGDNVSVHSAVQAKFLPSNEVVDTEFHDLWTIKDGKITSLLQFIDTAMVNAVVDRAQFNGFLPK